jgi:hypothetical protein
MKLYLITIMVLNVFWINICYAEEHKRNVAPQKIDLDSLAGVYFVNHKIDFAPFNGAQREPVTDVLEIVPYDENGAYVRAKLVFDNGHGCSFYGFAKQDGNKLTHYSPSSKDICIMDVIPSKTEVKIFDRNDSCARMTCGMRGTYSNVSFPISKKRTIKYINNLKNSVEYKQSLEDYKTRLESEAKGILPEWAYAKKLLADYAFWGNVEGVKQSLNQGANPNFLQENEWTPLTGAAYSRNIEITKLLIDRGLEINASQNGQTFLTVAAMPTHGSNVDQTFQYIKWLLDNGADPKLKNSKGQIPLDVAIETKADQRIIDLLK